MQRSPKKKRIRHHPKPISDPQIKSHKKATAFQQIKTFTTQFKGTVARTLRNSEASLFKPSKAARAGLVGLGIQGNKGHASIASNIAVTQHEQQHIALALIHLSRTINRKHCLEFLRNERDIIPIELKLKGKANWDSTMIVLNAKDDASGCTGMLEWKNKTTTLQNTIKFVFFQCPRCPHVEYSSCKAFQTHDIDQKQRCNGCNTTTKVNEWKCECGTYWHNCTTHRFSVAKQSSDMMRETNTQASEITSSNKQAKFTRIIGIKRKVTEVNHPTTYEEMLEQDVKTAKRTREYEEELLVTNKEPSIILGKPKIKTIRVSSLGPILKKRFIHPGPN